MRAPDALNRLHAVTRAAPQAARGAVVSYTQGTADDPRTHESVTRRVMAEKLARLKGYVYAGEYDAGEPYPQALYFVPAETLVGLDLAHAMGIYTEDDLFGGVVPHAFVGTKSITHPLIDERAPAPAGWSAQFWRGVRGAVLPGYSAFDPRDARAAGLRLLAFGPVRVKPALGIGGRGQAVVENADELEAAIAAIDADEIATCGVALEQNMSEVTTYSVGQVTVGGLTATYFGTQKLTRDNSGAEVYGGSALTVARGDFDALLALEVEGGARLAIRHARAYDAQARRCFRGLFASRRNYDVVQGRNRAGARLCGVLEQSWRIGGASGAEIAALEAFRDDPALASVRAECTEIYGESAEPPRSAMVYFRGVDPVVGRITKYTTVERHADA